MLKRLKNGRTLGREMACFGTHPASSATCGSRLIGHRRRAEPGLTMQTLGRG